MSKLAERAARFPEPWKPEPNDVLEGVVTELDWRDSDYSEDQYPILTVLGDDGIEQSFHGFHTMARLEIERKKPRIGDRIAIAYHGLGQAKPGMEPPHRYRVVVDGQPANTEGQPEGQLELTGTDGDDGIPF
jgi:hypothetical protein